MNHRQQKKLSRRLFQAIWSSDTGAAKAALRAGAAPERRNDVGTTPLYEASVSGRAEIATLLLVAGAAPDTESAGLGAEGTPLCAAACWGHTATVRTLLAHGANPNLREEHGTGRPPIAWTHDGPHGPHHETAALLTAAGVITAG
ncbi:ankyrin repeat domain-containing protein [Streptomyces sp. NPDC057743]|uniref:ankyrin repeat domain-containing protein n=1 Tax=Streptomyces sp. NPDC057743 TaxID=3346236 RepID=UPI0036C5FD04